MKRIDRETVQRILDAADIVEVVSDFVNLKKRGANWIGLCPFHNERTPSFSVSRAKGICKCFSCGKGGSPVNFIMEHEQMSFNEALRYLAKKYNIEIREEELSEEEMQLQSERESMLAVNDFAQRHFSDNLTKTVDGRDIGLAYFRERGINDLMIERFRLGYAIDRPSVLYDAAVKAGYDPKYLVQTGLCSQSEQHGTVYDRFRGRVIYPVFTLSGRVVAFGGRTLRTDKKVAKYVNSPESLIYSKRREIYGLYQAKSEIVRRNKCIMVEGYMDVISMHQVGITNVVASSGTSLTQDQIRLIHRFTENLTLIYDADPAGIKASLRGIDLLLAEGMNIKVLSLPDGEDPDSFAQSHSAQQVEQYIAEHEVDFMRFKTAILLKDAQGDPIARARVINDILRSIAVIPDVIVRAEYVKECSRMLEIDENTLMLQLTKVMGEQNDRGQNDSGQNDRGQNDREQNDRGQNDRGQGTDPKMRGYEQELMKYIVKYGLAMLPPNEGQEPITVLDYVKGELSADDLTLTDPVLSRIFDEALLLSQERWPSDSERRKRDVLEKYYNDMAAGREEIRLNAADLADIEAKERALTERCSAEYNEALEQYAADYIREALISSPDDDIRRVATDLAMDKYTLSKVHTRYAHIETERERLVELVPRAILELKLAILNRRIDSLNEEIRRRCTDPQVIDLLQEQKNLYEIRSTFSHYLGERIVTPKR